MDSSDRTATNGGTGPGVITADGCAVEFYALLPPRGEPEIVHAAAGSRQASILELGAGTGRIADFLAAMGHPVTAVDESPEMLAHIQHAETVCAKIEGLALGMRFDVVLLASFLVNAPGEAIRAAFLQTCARHARDTGCVIIQQHPPTWFVTATAGEYESDGITIKLRDISRPGPRLLSATVEYRVDDRVWSHSFTTMRLSEEDLRSELDRAGLTLDHYLTDDRQWLRAVPQ